MWWQGVDKIPDDVKLCRASLMRHCGSRRIITLTKDNYQNYITLPEHILTKFNAGLITITHLSDIIRAGLLAKYGGMWIDATMLVDDEIPEEFFSLEYYTIRRVKKASIHNPTISLSRWTGYFISARDTNSLLFCYMYDMFSEYWKNHDSLINYYLIDYVIAVAFEELPEFRSAWEKIPVNNVESWNMFGKLMRNEEWNEEWYANLRRTTRFFKTTYKRRYYTRTAEGKETVYGHLLSEYGITPSE